LNARTATRIGQLLLPCRNEYFDVTGLATTDGSAPIVPTRIQCFRSKYDHLRSAVVNEPPGSDAVVGALICEPTESSCAAGVVHPAI
jgi:proline racemase